MKSSLLNLPPFNVYKTARQTTDKNNGAHVHCYYQ